jgi:hypothetical protein
LCLQAPAANCTVCVEGGGLETCFLLRIVAVFKSFLVQQGTVGEPEEERPVLPGINMAAVLEWSDMSWQLQFHACVSLVFLSENNSSVKCQYVFILFSLIFCLLGILSNFRFFVVEFVQYL